jgi:hypothetical protein
MEEEKSKMTDSQGYSTTPKLLQTLERHAAGEDVMKELLAYCRKGYFAAEETVISYAESGDKRARSTLTDMLIREQNSFQPDQTRRAFNSCDLDAKVKKHLLTKKANTGEHWAVESLKELDPPSKQHIDRLGFVIEETILKNLGGKDGFWTQHITREDVRSLEHELLSEGDSPLEALLVRRIALCYLALQYFECLYFQSMERPMNPRQHSLLLQRLHQANERYLSSVRTLAKVRKMKLPNLQVNIGEKQINVAS